MEQFEARCNLAKQIADIFGDYVSESDRNAVRLIAFILALTGQYLKR
jgi:hypothetical protein